jgi:acetylornithine/succinyldiaminopimelate/putrescine aminotransferase
MVLDNSGITKQEILKKSVEYWNPGKVADWHNKGIDLVMGRREGYYFSDMEGNRYLDIHINGGTFNLGHRNPELIEAMIEATQEFDIGNHHFPSVTRALLSEKLASLCPGDLQYSVFSPSGGEAVDVAIKSARYATKRKKVISLSGSYHGHTGLSVSAGDPLFKDPFLCQGEDGMFVQVPLNDLEAMERELKKEDTALVLIETLLATYGFPLPQMGYLKAVKALCEKYGALYAADEVQTGLMRTGKLWGFEHEGFIPDILISAKGFGGGIYPIAATVLTKRSAQWLFDIGRLHGSTTGGSELGCCVALKVLEITTRQSTVDSVHANTLYLQNGMDALQRKYSDFFLGYKQRGVIMGLDFDCKDAAVSVVKPLFDNGVWAHNARLHPNTLQLKLGLLCDKPFLDELFEKMDTGIGNAREIHSRGRQ